MRRLAPLLVLLAVTAAHAQTSDAVRTIGANGEPVDLSAVVAAMADADVVFLGEQHDDSVAHALQLEILQTLLAGERPLVLALEMVETDVQTVLDEYLVGLVREQDWLAAGRPWTNYAAAYRPLIEAAKEAGRPVVATNAPGRYVTLVAREGVGALDSLSETARAWLPPLPVAPASDALAAKFADAVGGMAHGSGPSVEAMLAAQNLRDATMAWRLADVLERHPGALVVHVNGSFHSEGGLGIPEHLARYAPDARVFTVTMRPVADPSVGSGQALDAAPEPGGGDVVILTRADG